MGLVDLDELALRCRDEKAKEFIREAVLCYKAGAYRSCVVATWNAVVFDFLHKLRELELSGDKNAKKVLEKFEIIRSGGEAKLKEALDFERSVLDVAATEFELLTPLEKEDLSRLHVDRNRCAHPSMQSEDIPYVPTAELARTHLRSAVEILLEREPVQGVAALTRVFSEIQSEYFPQNKQDAVDHFMSGPLKRARPTLIRNLIVAITKSNLRDDTLGFAERKRQRIALAAIFDMHRHISEDFLDKELPAIVQSLDDTKLIWLIAYCHYIPEAWAIIGEPYQKRIVRFIQGQTGKDLVLISAAAVNIVDLKPIVLEMITQLSAEQFATLIGYSGKIEYIPVACKFLEEANTFRSAEFVFEKTILPLCQFFTLKDVENVLKIVIANDQAYYASGTQTLITQFYENTRHITGRVNVVWDEFVAGIDSVYTNPDKSGWYEGIKDKLRPPY